LCVVGCGLRAVGCGLWAVGCGLWAVGCGLWVEVAEVAEDGAEKDGVTGVDVAATGFYTANAEHPIVTLSITPIHHP
jgi:hypothetical protein